MALTAYSTGFLIALACAIPLGGTAQAACYLHHGEAPGDTADDAAGEAVEAWAKEVTAQHGKDYADWRTSNQLRLVCDVITRGSGKGRGPAWFCSVDGEAGREGDDCGK